MKKTLSGIITMFALMTACKKDDPKNTGTNYFKINGTTYAATVANSGSGLVASSGTSSTSLTVAFATTPTAAASYAISSTAISGSEVGVTIAYDNKVFLASGTPAVTAAVTIQDGKFKIVMPEFSATSFPGGEDSIKVSASLVQP